MLFQPPVIVVPAPVVNYVPPAGLPGWVAPVAGLIGVFLGTLLSSSRDHQKWLYERRVDIYLRLFHEIIEPDNERMRQTEDIPLARLRERLPDGAATENEIALFAGLKVRKSFEEYRREDWIVHEEWARLGREGGDDWEARLLVSDLAERCDELGRALRLEIEAPPGILAIADAWNRRRDRQRENRVVRTLNRQINGPEGGKRQRERRAEREARYNPPF